MSLIDRGVNYVTIWFSTFITFLILWIRKIRPAAALTDSLTVDGYPRSISPVERFNELLDNEEYEEALKLAKKYELDTDPVYKRRWLKSRLTADSIRLLLTPINDHDWVILQCLTCIASDVETNKELLSYGQSLVEELLNSIQLSVGDDVNQLSKSDAEFSFDTVGVKLRKKSSKDNEKEPILTSQSTKLSQPLEWHDLDQVNLNDFEDEEKAWFGYRYLFVKYLDRLKSYEKILQSNSRDMESINQEFWKQFRDQSCFEAALGFARKGEWRSVKVMLSRHTSETKEHWLPILSNFPETLKPALYQDLLPCGDTQSDQIYLWIQPQKSELNRNDADDKWCLKLADLLQLEAQANLFIDHFYSTNSFYSDFRRAKLDKNVASTWFSIRAREIESRSSLVSNAIELLELGIDRNIPDLESFKDDLDTYATLVYQCFPMYNMDDIGFSEFERLSKEERVNLLMLGASDDEERFVECLNRFLLPYLSKIAKNKKEEQELLWDYIVNTAKHKLNIVQKIFTSYKMTKELSQVSGNEVIKSDEELIDYGIRCIYANERTDQLDAAFNIVETFPEPESPFFEDDQERNEKVIALYSRLEVAELLEQYHYYITVQRIEEMVKNKDSDGLITILNKITREFCRKVDNITLKEQDWIQFLNDLERIRGACFTDILPLADVYEVFIKGILTSGRLEHFKIAAGFMQLNPSQLKKKLITFDKSAQAILEAARHYVNSANSVSDEIIYTAKKCLALIGDEDARNYPEIQKEKDFIEALSILDTEFDFSILPIQVRLMEDSKIELIHQIISSQPKAYKKTNELMRLSKILNIFEENNEEANEVKLLTILGNYAFERDDYSHCWSLCKIFIDQGYSSGWRLCELLGNCSAFKDNYAKLKLLSFAVIYCDNCELIFEILNNIRKLKLILLEESIACLQETQDLSGMPLPLPLSLSSLSSSATSALSSLPTIEITSKLIKSMKRKTAQVKTKEEEEENEANERQMRRKDSSKTYNSINISPFYCDAFQKSCHFTFNQTNCDYNYLGFGDLWVNQVNLELSNNQLRLRTEMLKDDINWNEVRHFCQELSYHYLPIDTVLSLSSILPLKNTTNDELPFSKINPKPPALIFIALYFYSLIVCLKNLDENDGSSNITREPMSQIITKADQLCKAGDDASYSEDKKMIDKYFELYCNVIQSETIASLDPNVDVDRFACDEEYRKDTLLGLAMTTDDKIFNVVISLGRQYDLPLIDLYLTHLEFLLTDPSNDVEDIANKIYNNADFLKNLSDNPKYLENYFESRIFPLIAYDDHNRLVLCYQIIEKICYPPNSPSSQDGDDDACETGDNSENII